MKKVSNDVLTPNQVMFMLIGSMIGMGVLNLPNDVIKYAKQDGWISAFLGAVYPLYIVCMGLILHKKFPNNNILFINEKCFGKFLGSLLNILLLLYFLLYTTAVVSGLSNILRTIIVTFLPEIKVIIVIVFLGAYTASKGLKILGRINETIFYLTIVMILITLSAIGKGRILYLRPILGSGIINILKSSKESAFSYAGIEIFLFIYPYISENKQLNKVAIKSVLITACLYLWVTLITIYSIGIDVIPKYIFSFPVVARYVQIPVINNFRFIFMVLWFLIAVKTISNYYYTIISIIGNFFKKTNPNKICAIMYPIIVFLSMQYFNETLRENFLSFITPKVTMFMIIYVAVTAIFVHFRKEDKVE